jgi:D-alanyl-D-alanine carboxypeptidase
MDAIARGWSRVRHAGFTVVVVTILTVTCALVGTSEVAGAKSAPDGTTTRCTSGKRAPGGDICVARGSALATRLLDGVREVEQRQPIRGLVFGVWIKGKQVLTGAMGEQVGGVPTTRDVHFRLGNTAETMMGTLLLRLVDQGKVHLDDPVSKWYPDLPAADQVTLEMLASNTSGYADYATTDEFSTRLEADPFQEWTPDELLAIAMKQPPVFAPGTSWAFSDTNYMLLGQILQKESGRPYPRLVKAQILDRVGMRNTSFPTTSAIPAPVLHSYTNERGNYEEATFWSPSDFPNNGSEVTTLDDLGKWTRALGTGSLLSKRSHDLQVGDQNVGLGPLTEQAHYGVGVIISHGWIYSNPQFNGYTGVIGYLPAKKATVVIASTFTPKGDITVQYGAAVFNRVAEILSPENAPNVTVCPRGC